MTDEIVPAKNGFGDYRVMLGITDQTVSVSFWPHTYTLRMAGGCVGPDGTRMPRPLSVSIAVTA